MKEVCGAKTRAGTPCQRAPVAGRTRCRLHGGASPLPGPSHPNWKHGRRSRYSEVIPDRLGARYVDSLTDPELLNLTEEIALLDSHLGDVLRRTERGEAGQLWLELKDLWEGFKEARTAGDADGMARVLDGMGRLIDRGAVDALAWREVRDILRDRERLVASERKRRVEIQAMLDIRQGVAFVERVLAAVERHVSDRQALAEIANELRPLLSLDGPTG